MKHTTLWNTVAYPNDPGDDRIQGDEWNQSHTLESDENFVTDAQLALLIALGTNRYAETFDSTDLDGNGDITITHSRNYQFPQVMVVNDSGVKIEGYKTTFDDANNLTLRILGAGTFTDWRVEVLGATAVSRFSEIFDSTDLDGNKDITFTHGRGYQFPQVQLVDDSDIKKEGYKVTYDSTTQCTLRILGAGSFTNWRVEIV